MPDLKLLKIFKVVAEEENMTHASERLYIAQPAITRYIKELENELNIKLFDRTNKGLKLTDEGIKLYNKIKNPIDELDNISVDNKIIKIGSHFTFYSKLFGEKISNIYKNDSSISIDLINKETDEMINDLKNKKIDIVLSKKVDSILDKDIEYIKVGEIHDIVVCSKNNSNNITIDDIKNNIVCMPGKTTVSYKNFFKTLNLNEKDFKNIKNISYNTMVIMINNLKCYGLLTEEYFKEDLEKGSIKKVNINKELITEYGIYYNKNTSEMIKSIINYLK